MMLSNVLACRNYTLSFRVLLLLLATFIGGQAAVKAQSQTLRTTPTIEGPATQLDRGIGRNNLECTGYFRLPPLKGLPQIVGGEQEQEKHVYASGDYVYIDAGSSQGIREGQEFHVIRPRGEVKHVFTQKKGYLGVFVQEVGQLQVIRVNTNVSVAQISFSCDPILLGDLLTGVPDRSSPQPQPGISFDRFSDPSGKPTGRIVMARDRKEMVGTGDLIYIDIGDEDKVVPGDYVTIYRKVGTGNLGTQTDREIAPKAEKGFASEHYRGGSFSNNSLRASDMKGEPGIYRHRPITTPEIKEKRPAMPRKIVGEAMIINVQVRTATALIMRVAQEVHTGDFVELR